MKNKGYQTKQSLEIKDMDSTTRTVVVYLAKFDNIDSDCDMILKGAFKKSIQERGPESSSNRKIAFLRHHDWMWQIGKFNKLEEDENGLLAYGQLGTSTQGEDAWRDYEDQIIREHSIGFQYLGDKMKWVDDVTQPCGGYWMISEVKLWEGSAVTFGANDLTNVVEVMKSEDKISEIDKTSDELNTVIKALANGKGTDERLFQLEMKANVLSTRLKLLASVEPFKKEHSKGEQPTNTFDWAKVINNIK
jgi:HK97 family phage prohead protease